MITGTDAHVNVRPHQRRALPSSCQYRSATGDSLMTKDRATASTMRRAWPAIGSHVGFDATRKLAGEGYHRAWPEELSLPAELIAGMEKRFPRSW